MAGSREDQLQRMRERARSMPSVLVETGTYRGKSTAIFAGHFDRVHTIELNPRFHAGAKKVLAQHANVECHLGDSAEWLQTLCADITEPAVFFLDAHNIKRTGAVEGGFPLWKELQLVAQRNLPDLVVVDDVHTFGKERPTITFEGERNWEDVSEASICEALAPREIVDHYIYDDVCVVELA